MAEAFRLAAMTCFRGCVRSAPQLNEIRQVDAERPLVPTHLVIPTQIIHNLIILHIGLLWAKHPRDTEVVCCFRFGHLARKSHSYELTSFGSVGLANKPFVNLRLRAEKENA